MKLKASIDYGVRAMMYLAIKGGTCSSKEIAEHMDIPRDYLIQLGLKLRNAGLINARPGKNGGYTLAKEPSEVSIHQIVAAFEETYKDPRHPLTGKHVEDTIGGKVANANALISSSVDMFLGRITIQDLLDAGEQKEGKKEFFSRIQGE
ncbi:hypothetical protein JI75_00770 [Berryella intestinalis]|uniref:Rrf2 family transcriptional regulator n=1 Tax=Berryella intestinalis TaxID=1531429 RepID=A0A0A8B248_9ACTN|nr:Rrf2 family transcriptional regulator [Berryella intestinalis]AJC11449.1 hypothetical protein JI75_00770 [Berryella intestinalis]